MLGQRDPRKNVRGDVGKSGQKHMHALIECIYWYNVHELLSLCNHGMKCMINREEIRFDVAFI